MSEPPPIADPGRLSALHGQVVRLRGRYSADPKPLHRPLSPGGQGSVGAVLMMDGNVPAALGQRHGEEALRLNGKVVVASGELVPPAPYSTARAEALPEPVYALLRIGAIETTA